MDQLLATLHSRGSTMQQKALATPGQHVHVRCLAMFLATLTRPCDNVIRAKGLGCAGRAAQHTRAAHRRPGAAVQLPHSTIPACLSPLTRTNTHAVSYHTYHSYVITLITSSAAVPLHLVCVVFSPPPSLLPAATTHPTSHAPGRHALAPAAADAEAALEDPGLWSCHAVRAWNLHAAGASHAPAAAAAAARRRLLTYAGPVWRPKQDVGSTLAPVSTPFSTFVTGSRLDSALHTSTTWPAGCQQASAPDSRHTKCSTAEVAAYWHACRCCALWGCIKPPRDGPGRAVWGDEVEREKRATLRVRGWYTVPRARCASMHSALPCKQQESKRALRQGGGCRRQVHGGLERWAVGCQRLNRGLKPVEAGCRSQGRWRRCSMIKQTPVLRFQPCMMACGEGQSQWQERGA
eukprot:365467-Chlamydomonas_euryale.AAC.12